LAVLAVGLVTLAGYVGGYLAMSDYAEGLVKDNGQRIVFRQFPHVWQATAFWPAGQAEGWFKQTDVSVESETMP
jgi:hypothetical protein